MNTTRKCPQCGATLAADAPEGLCAKCLVKVGLGSNAETMASPEGGRASEPIKVRLATPAPPDTTEIAKRFPQLEILELLGAGGMGVVYKARQPQLDRLVALKLLPAEAGRDPAFAERFAREARALAKLNHPNIVAVYDFGQTGRGDIPVTPAEDGDKNVAAPSYYYFIMEFVDGANLRQMERAGKLTAGEALAIVPKICDALQYAHEEGIVHRDIKPENILVDKKGRVKIADFGLAKLLGKAATDFTLTSANQAMGTPHYMAPEQMEKPLSVDHRADIYSLGVVFYEMLTGELPLGRFQPPSAKVHVDVRLDEVVLRSMERDVERRYQHVSEVKTDVESIAQSGTGVPPVSPKTLGQDAQATDAIRRQVKGPAIGLLATSIFLWVIAFIITSVVGGLVLFMKHPAGQPDLTPLLASVPIVLIITWATLLMVGAQKMKRLESYGWAMTASILATVGGGLGMPFGIWALVVLLRPEVKAAFGAASPPVVGAAKPSTNWVKIVVGCLLVIPVVIGLLASGLWLAWRSPKTRGPVTTLRAFTAVDRTISTDLVEQDGGWFANCAEPRTIQLFEVPNPSVEDCTVTYRAQLKAEGLKGRAYLEMWCRLPGRGEFFSKGLNQTVSGSKDWASYEIPFFLKKGEKPDLLRLNLVVEGTGRVGIRNVEVLTNAKRSPAAPVQPLVSKSQARPALSADQIRVEDTAIQLLAAMRDKDEKAMREMATDSIIKTWPGALIYFASELRERYQHEFEKPLALWPTETFIDGDFAVVRCTSKDTKAKLNNWYLGLIFYKMKDGSWRNAALAGATPDLSLAAFLANFKAQNMPATPKQNTDALRAQAEQLLKQGKYDEVITAVSKAIEQDAKNPLPWYRRATARSLKGETANALADLKKAIELDPTLKSRAASDAFFKSLQDNAEFKSLTK